jgi:hypothetical protein
MWSSLLKGEENNTFNSINKEYEFNIVPINVETNKDRIFKSTINEFIKEHKFILDYLFNKHFKDYVFISKEDFYIFAYNNSTVDERLSRIYKRYSN